MTELERSEIVAVIDGLFAGTLSREAASRWAAPHCLEDHEDAAISESLELLVGSDALQLHGDPPYLNILETEAGPVPVSYLYDLEELAAARHRLTTTGE